MVHWKSCLRKTEVVSSYSRTELRDSERSSEAHKASNSGEILSHSPKERREGPLLPKPVTAATGELN